MALLDMKRMTLIAHADSKDQLLRTLQDMGAVEVISTQLDELRAGQAPESLGELEKRLADVRESLEVIRIYDTEKTSFLTPKPAISREAFSRTNEKFADADKAVAQIKQFSEDMSALKARRQRLKNKITQLEPYEGFDAPLESICPGQYTTCLLGSLPSEAAEEYQRIRETFADSAYFESVGESKGYESVYVIMDTAVHEKLIGELKYIGFSEAYIKDLYGTPRDLLFDFESECDTLDAEAEEYKEKAKKFADDKRLLQCLEDFLVNEIGRERTIEKAGETGTAFFMEGWLIAEHAQAVEDKLLTVAPEAYITFRDPAEDEVPPTAVSNPKTVAPFEAVTDMYAVPSSKGLDPNLIMSVFYFLIFGMMIGDFAYGIFLTLGALLVLRLKKPTGMFRKITTVIMICGISTAFWGLFFGTIFSIPGIPSVINPIDDAMTMLVLTIGIGVVHILVGLGIGAFMAIRRGKIWDAIFDNVSWMLVLIGGIVYAIGFSFGQYIVYIGVAILLLTAGRHKKGIMRKIIGGFASIYGATGYVSDILSYCRIFGMGLATTVIAMVFNTIATMLMGGVVGYIFGLVVLTVGHVFNLAINALGAFVHTARLQYIEFFSKFYEGGGHTFMPLGVRTKNYRLQD
jgi:V/A-type H+-transporting ATPase subunit I